MKLHRFYIEGEIKEKIFNEKLIHQWKSVFRLEKGDAIILFDGSGFEYLCEIKLLTKKEAEIKVIEKNKPESYFKREVFLFVSIIKKDKFEWVLEKGTEVGVSHFVPIISERTEKKKLNQERAEKIVKEASEQSGRVFLPKILEPLSLDKVMKDFKEIPLYNLHFGGQKFDPEKMPKKLGVLVGPEGGWGEKDLKVFQENKIPAIDLGSRVLRSETAAIAVASLLLL